MTTAVNITMFTMLNARQTMSGDLTPEGNMSTMQTQTPNAHARLMSFDDLRLTIRIIKGILKNGRITAATNPTF